MSVEIDGRIRWRSGPSAAVALALTACLAASCGTGGPEDGAEARSGSDARGEERGPTLDAEAIGLEVGTEARARPDGTVRVTWARTDVPVRVDGVELPAPAGLTSWAAFAPSGDGAMVMGDTVVFQDEAGPAMDAAFAHDLDITALHNHFFYDEPKVYFMHLGGHGPPAELAGGVRAVWDAVREVRRRQPEPARSFPGEAPSPGDAIDPAAVQRITGVEPSVSDGVVKVTIPREASMAGTAVAGSMGLTTWAAFTGGDALATVDGDFAMTAEEVQPVLRALRQAGIQIVALHNHMVGEEPAYYFTHYWGKGSVEDLARAFRAALEAQRRGAGDVAEDESPGGSAEP